MSLEPILFDAGNPGPMTGRGNNTWLIDGAEPTLIDAGVGLRPHIDAIAAHLSGRPLARVLVTHGHADHASGVPALRAEWPDVEVWTWRPLSDGQPISAGDGVLQVIETPGHAEDHVCFRNVSTGSIFVGDMLALGTTIMVPAGRGGHLRSYLTSLERIASLDPTRAYPGHGPVIDDPQALIAQYLEHRALREREVLECIRAGLTDAESIVDRIYPDLLEAVRFAAVATVEAHLEKIREDGVNTG